jgi:tRNA (guanine-N7-)-methyltransferase
MARVLKEYTGVALKVEELDGKIDFGRVFGLRRACLDKLGGAQSSQCGGPVHIEIGCGKATFLLNQARAQPAVNFLGIEWASRYYRYAVDRIGRWGLDNVRIIRADAAGLLANFVPDESVEGFHIYFPDPWPKRRHHRRRFVCPANLQQLLRCLRAGGELRIATDHLDYFQKIQELIDTQVDKLEKIDFLPAAGANQGEWLGTNFERKYLKENRPIYTLAVRKK